MLVSTLLERFRNYHGETEFMISSVTVMELEHGLNRVNTIDTFQRRRDYLDTIFESIPVQAFTKEMGQLAGKIDAKARSNGIVIPFADLLIGAAALQLGYAICTQNVRHFRLIPGLEVIAA